MMDVSFAEIDVCMNALLYLRVSSADQVKNFSLQTQEDICRSFADRLGYTVTEVFREEGESASTADRTQLIRIIDYCRLNTQKVGAVIVYDFSRFARDTSDHLIVKKKLASYGVRLLSTSEMVDNTPSGVFVETVLAAKNQLENELKAEKARVGLMARFKAGYPTSKPPVGYISKEINGKKQAVPDPVLFELLKNVWGIMATGTKTLPEMAVIMNELGITMSNWKNHKITKQSASKIFKNRFYCGWCVSKKYHQEVKGIHFPMISEETYYRVQDVISGRRTNNVRHLVDNPDFNLRGIVKHSCGKYMTAANVKGRSKHYPLYWCPKCHDKSISAEKLETQLKAHLASLQPSQSVIDLFTLHLHAQYNQDLALIKENRKNAQQEGLETKRMLTLLVEGHLKGLYPDDIFKEQRERLENKLLATKIIENDNICEKYDIEVTTNFTKALLKDLVKAYEHSDYGQKKILIGSIYPLGLVVTEGVLLNPEVCPMFRAIKALSNTSVPFGAEKYALFEPLPLLQQLILAYPNYQSQFNYA
jgi:DNA invertase Pin-like site-specific DNA recombinase